MLFPQELDLLDFPGARTRLQIKDEGSLGDATTGATAWQGGLSLFNKYSRALMISSILFCHHNDQRTEPGIGASISKWIQENIGRNPQEGDILGDYGGDITALLSPLSLISSWSVTRSWMPLAIRRNWRSTGSALTV